MIVSYIDPLASMPVLSSQVTSNPDSILPPANPSHTNMTFTGWVEAHDIEGNIIFVAAYSCENCENRECAICPINPSQKRYIVPKTSTMIH